MSRHEEKTLYVGEHRRMLAYGRENGIPTRNLIWAGGGDQAIRGFTGPIHVIIDVPDDHHMTHRELMALEGAGTINMLYGHAESARTENIYTIAKGASDEA